MQSKGTIKLITVLLILACLYQLSFTWVTSSVESKAKKYATVIDENGITRIDEKKQTDYLDSMAAVKAYPLGLFTYRECKEKELALGLDLKGGMNVMLEISVSDMVRALANNSNDPDFQKTLDATELKYRNSGSDFLVLFEETWSEIAPNKKMSTIFATYEQSKSINSSSSNRDVINFIREQTESTINNSFNVLRNRIDRFGVVSPNIQRVPGTGRILVELPGIKEPERVRKLLQGTASLEFWETFDCRVEGISDYIINSDKKIKELRDAEKALAKQSTTDTTGTEVVAAANDDPLSQLAATATTDSINTADTLLSALGQDSTNMAAENAANLREQYPLLSILSLNTDADANGKRIASACVGRAHYRDTTKINQMLALPQILGMKPSNLRFAWTSKATGKEGVVYELIAIKLNPRYGNEAPLSGDAVVSSRKEFNQAGGS
ncbi:MAG: protein translocase subunit SecDF, partial [Prevotellaceae bacterium]|nr:protein translocase subunit SecDF [Prevotellaceae bacterium]